MSEKQELLAKLEAAEALAAKAKELQATIETMAADAEATKQASGGIAAQVAAVTKERDAAREDLAKAQVELAALREDKKKMAGDALINRYVQSGQLQDHHLQDASGEPKPLKNMAYDDPATFESIVNEFPVIRLADAPAGFRGNDLIDPNDVEEMAYQQARLYCDAHPEANKDFVGTVIRFKNEIMKKKEV